jgi:hypothetical protein
MVVYRAMPIVTTGLTWCTSQFQWDIETVTSGTCIPTAMIRCKPDGAKYIIDGSVDDKPSDNDFLQTNLQKTPSEKNE